MTFEIAKKAIDLFFQINKNNSGSKIVCAIDTKEVGIDVEKIEDIDLEIGKRFFAMDEYQLIQSQKKDEKLKFFFKIWTLKEAYVKAEGKGLSIPLDSFSFEYNQGHFSVRDNALYHCFQYDLEGYIMSICSQAKKINRYETINVTEWIKTI